VVKYMHFAGSANLPRQIMKCYVYILQNQKGRHYIGITKLTIGERVKRHNKGDVYSTKSGRPWNLVYIEEFDSYEKAREREKQIKSWHSGNAFKKLIAGSAGSSNGRTTDSGSVYLGSNPSPAALAMRKFGGVK
jgi:putative endonuclease